MTWFERAFTAFGLIAIAFSLGCVVRGESATMFHGICVTIHATIVFAYAEMYLKRRRRLTTHACRR